ncbi:hypothetical protein GCM10023220_44330 [Streptomyces ziwulingensis]|uniref:Uncharacterized protein n=1 Tax=Streptomyces ziwulingensis TaxID=1045501 RepID=A0ABP9CIN4_9ACTN
MITRGRLVALALTVVLSAGAACQARDHHPPPGRPAPPPEDTGAFTLVASGDVPPYRSVIDRARFDAGATGHDFRPMRGNRSTLGRALARGAAKDGLLTGE